VNTIIRAYTEADQKGCLEVFDSNLPKYFSIEERQDFATFLKQPSCVYLVMEQSGEVVGCGGYYVNRENREAGLCWGLVHRRFHGTGLGKRLALERLERILRQPEVGFIRLDTSQHTFGFFEKLGFVTENITPNGYWDGLDRYDMRLRLDETARQRIIQAYQGVQP